MMVQYTVQIGIDSPGLPIPDQYRGGVIAVQEEASKQGFEFVIVSVEAPKKPKSTGDRSQNNRFHGHCRDIAGQLKKGDGTLLWSASEIKDAILWMAVDNGYPSMYDPTGRRVPMSWERASKDDAVIAQTTLEAFADSHRLWLTEYDDNGWPYKAIGGQPIDEEIW